MIHKKYNYRQLAIKVNCIFEGKTIACMLSHLQCPLCPLCLSVSFKKLRFFSRFWLLLCCLSWTLHLLSPLLLSFVVFPQLIDRLSHGVHDQALYLWGYLCFLFVLCFITHLRRVIVCGIQVISFNCCSAGLWTLTFSLGSISHCKLSETITNKWIKCNNDKKDESMISLISIFMML